jgi:hypothetical protein
MSISLGTDTKTRMVLNTLLDLTATFAAHSVLRPP